MIDLLEDILPGIQESINNIIHSPIFIQYGLVGLFANGFLSSTVLPIPTEITTSALLASGYGKMPVFTVLVTGSIAGGFLGYYTGRSGRKLFRFLKGKRKNQDEEYGDGILRKYGWIAIFGSSWIPVVGDVIPVIAGARKYDLRAFALAMSAGKVAKSVFIVYLSSFIATSFFGPVS